MASAIRSLSTVQLALLVAVCLGTPGCEDDEAPTGPTPVTSGTNNAPQVSGAERLGWNQTGDVGRLRFRAYVDGRAVDLPAATCSASGAEAECGSPLPALADGVHTIELVNVQVSTGVESERSGAITLQKVTARASVLSFPLAVARAGALRLEPVVTFPDGRSFTADIVATSVRAPAQLSWLPDGRLLLSDADGRIRLVRPGEPESREPALEAAMLTSLPVDSMAVASHPEFAKNRFVYVSLLEHPRESEARLRIVRLREVGDTLGEPATLFEARVAGDASLSQAGPRMAFGPDRLLYVMLPPGLEFSDERAASTPRPAMLRVTDEGRIAQGESFSGITSTPLGFAWHPASGALWVMSRGQNGEASVRAIGGRDGVQAMSAQAPRLLAREGTGAAAGTLRVQSALHDLPVAQALLGTRADGSKGLARLALPVWNAGAEMADRVGDIVAGDGGTLFVATSNGLVGGSPGFANDVVVRLRPVATSR